MYADSGSVFYVTNSKLKYYNDENSIYGIYNCSQIDSGVIYAENNGYFVGLNLVIRDSYSSQKSSVLLVNQQAYAYFNNSQFINNYAAVQGTLIVEGSSSLLCTFCQFIGNFATDSSLVFADNNPEGQITFQDSLFENNTCKNNLCYMLYTTSYVTSSKFVNNIAQKVNHGFTLSNSDLSFDNVEVVYTDPTYLADNTSTVDTGFININFDSQLVISNSIFSNVKARTYGVLYATGSSNVSIDSNSVFQNCYSEIGAILDFSSTDQVMISSSSFVNNSLTDVQVQNGNATLNKNYFYKGNEQFIYATSSSLELTENLFVNGQNNAIVGKAIYCDCVNMTAIGNTFTNLSAAQGGALYITSSSANTVFHIHDNFFVTNIAQEGGAIYIQDGPLVTIWNNTFLQNQAIVINPVTQATSILSQKGQGGAIFYNCLNSLLNLDGNCIVQIENNNSFIQNQAQNDGGAIIWITNNFVSNTSNTFINNEAYYGNDIASYPKDLGLVFLTNNDYYNPVNNLRRLTDGYQFLRQLDSSGFDSLVSGIAFEFEIYIYDQEGNIYNTDSTSVATISTDSTDALLKYNIITANNGVYDFDNMLVYATPGSAASLSLSITGLETYGNNISFINVPITINAIFRDCVSGEEYLSSLACLKCSNTSFAYFAPSEVSSCTKCSADSNCYGGNATSPLPGFWRANDTTDSWVTCPNSASCLGGNESQPTGVCAEGYEGVACAVCEDNYSNTAPFTCSACPPRVRNIIQITFIMVFYSLYIAYLVRGSMKGANDVKPIYTVYMKIQTTHFQLIGIISNIDFDWPTQINSFFGAQTKTSSVSTQIYSFDCFLFNSQYTAEVGVYYEKLIIYALSPFILTIISVVYWLIYCRIKKDYSFFKDCLISTIVVLLFMVHPNICAQMFSAFNCIELDGIFYLRSDVSSICYQGHHLFYVLIVVLPSCVVWVIGIPLFALACLYSNRQIISHAETAHSKLTDKQNKDVYQVKMKYGFLFDGYNTHRYYWEILVFFRKIILIMTTVFLSVISPESQVLVSLLVVIVNMFAHIFYEPFYTKTLNKMEMYSLMVVSLTMYCGLFYITGSHYTYMNNNALRWFFLFFLVFPNALFFSYWGIYMNIEIMKMVFKKSKKLFKIITCGCIDIQKFENKYMKPENEEESEEPEKEGLEYESMNHQKSEEINNSHAGPDEIQLQFKHHSMKQTNITKKSKKDKKLTKSRQNRINKDNDLEFDDLKDLQKQDIRKRNKVDDQDDHKECEVNYKAKQSKKEIRNSPLKVRSKLEQERQDAEMLAKISKHSKNENNSSSALNMNDKIEKVYTENEIEARIQQQANQCDTPSHQSEDQTQLIKEKYNEQQHPIHKK